jgi:hypothetical protein
VRWWSPWKESTPDRPWIDDIEPPWRQAFHRLFLPDPKPGDKLPLPEDTEKSIPKNLDDKRLDSLLEQAVRISDGRRQWSTDSQARAVTMLGAVGVATGLILAGSTFLLNPDNQLAEGWRIVLSVLLGLTLVCFVTSGFVATRAVTKGLIWARPQLDRVLTRAQSRIRRRRVATSCSSCSTTAARTTTPRRSARGRSSSPVSGSAPASCSSACSRSSSPCTTRSADRRLCRKRGRTRQGGSGQESGGPAVRSSELLNQVPEVTQSGGR